MEGAPDAVERAGKTTDPIALLGQPAPTPDMTLDSQSPGATNDPIQQQLGAPNPTPSVTIGSSVFPITTLPPVQQTDQPEGASLKRPGVVIGSETLTPGQTKTINGVPVGLPENNDGSSVVVDGKTVPISPAGPTGRPVIVVESNSITADSQGRFVIGSQTLTPGGPAITNNGNTFSLQPSGSVAVVNGVTTALAIVPAPTPAPVLVVNGQTVSASVDKGTTQFVLGPGQTLSPGAVLTVSGTTFSMPATASGSVVVINGVTSTLSAPAITAAPALTVDGKTYSATVTSGTTQYVLGVGTTLKPGDAVTVSGTTYSLDPKGTALVINGQTSTIPRLPATNSASATRSFSFQISTSSGLDVKDKAATSASQSKKKSSGAAGLVPGLGFDKWIEGLVIGAAGWVCLWL